MKTTENAVRDRKGFARLTLVIVLIFAVMGASIWAVSKKTSDDMADAAILNLNENLNLMEARWRPFRTARRSSNGFLATELAAAGDPAAAVERLGKSDAAALISVVPEGADVGVSNDGAPFDPASLDFSGGGAIEGLPVSQAYVNAEGSWAYTVKCPIERDGVPIAELYTEYTFDAIDQSLPQGFYGQRAVLYLMDAATERFVLKPEGMGERDAGHVNLEDFYRANNITDPAILSMVADGVENRENVMFAHKVKGAEALCYLWSIGDGTTYLVGYVPMEAIQREAQAVNVALIMVASITIAAFCLCVILYGFNRRKQARAQRAREEERALHAEQLAQALRAAEVANESKSAFLANMSHDIRTPMNAVLGFTTIIEKEADNPAKVRDCAGKIMASGRHLLDLINDVLDISKIESGKASLTLAEFDLGDSLAAAESIIAPMARDKGQTFCAEIRSVRHERLIGDETHLNQILLNLLSNAVKYTPEGGRIWLRFIGLPAHSNALEHLRIEVEDDGYGMTPEFLKTIFDSFTRAENSTTNKVQGRASACPSPRASSISWAAPSRWKARWGKGRCSGSIWSCASPRSRPPGTSGSAQTSRACSWRTPRLRRTRPLPISWRARAWKWTWRPVPMRHASWWRRAAATTWCSSASRGSTMPPCVRPTACGRARRRRFCSCSSTPSTKTTTWCCRTARRC